MKNFEDIFLDIFGLYNRLQNFYDVTEHYINIPLHASCENCDRSKISDIITSNF